MTPPPLDTQLESALEQLRAAYPKAEHVAVNESISFYFGMTVHTFTLSVFNYSGGTEYSSRDYGQGSTIEAALADLKEKTDPARRAAELRAEADKIEQAAG